MPSMSLTSTGSTSTLASGRIPDGRFPVSYTHLTSGDERQAFKMVWLEKFQDYVLELERTRPKLILCGDYNICHEALDIHDPIRNATNSGFLPEEREWMTRFLDVYKRQLIYCLLRGKIGMY